MSEQFDFVTVADLVSITGQRAHIVNHAVRSYGPPPSNRIGTTRVWSRSQLPALQAAVEKTAERSTLPERRAVPK
jgi:hypothetical protein